jgi:hypothetical protein
MSGWISKAAELLCYDTSVVNTQGWFEWMGDKLSMGAWRESHKVFSDLRTQARILHDAFQDLGMENSR